MPAQSIRADFIPAPAAAAATPDTLLVRIRLWHFMLGTFLGMLPGVLAATVFGDQLEAALRDPARINYWVVAGVLIIFAVLTLAVRKWLARQGEVPAASARAANTAS